MSESTYEYEQVVPFPLDTVWKAIRRTSELDVVSGQKVIDRVSDAEWTCEFSDDVTTHCTTVYDEAAHTATVTLDATSKRVDDTTVISAREAEGGTLVHVETTIRGGIVVQALLKLVGKGGIEKSSASIVSNIVALCEGRATSILSADEIKEYTDRRVAELHEDGEDGE